MAYYSCMNYLDTSGYTAVIIVHGINPGQRLRFFLRLSNTQSLLRDEVLTASSDPFEVRYYGLAGNTSYTVNVGLVSVGDIVDVELGPTTFTTGDGGGPGPSNPRPADWSWWSPVYSGGLIQISANEWNAFCARINEFRLYRGLSVYNFTQAGTGTLIYAYIANQARDAIWDMNYYVPDRVLSGDPIPASFFLGLQTALNAIT